MPVRIISKKSLHDYIKLNPNSSRALLAWARIVEDQDWKQPLDIVQTFGSGAVDILRKRDNKPATLPHNVRL